MSGVIAVLPPVYLHGGQRDKSAFTSLHNFVHPLLLESFFSPDIFNMSVCDVTPTSKHLKLKNHALLVVIQHMCNYEP